ncbi:unnamed protein product [Pseudo-nitzschia multistriata]|uniref:Uncharacterized protein n=1 Tax=Pseudo-nitzschia multistriata TaxID=183589 RepID=A0A448ZPG1_9STRA|nr:unnamed protein product [Pseudo-nitzschia multistriata]
MRMRRQLEEHSSSGENDNSTPIIECPNLSDIVFRQGTSAMYHPGNVIFRSRIQHLFEEAKPFTMDQSTRTLVTKLMEEIRENNGRILIWSQLKTGTSVSFGDCWWTELRDQSQIYTKIENLVREFKYSKQKYQSINRGNGSSKLKSWKRCCDDVSAKLSN